jgi:hypothetical protein
MVYSLLLLVNHESTADLSDLSQRGGAAAWALPTVHCAGLQAGGSAGEAGRSDCAASAQTVSICPRHTRAVKQGERERVTGTDLSLSSSLRGCLGGSWAPTTPHSIVLQRGGMCCLKEKEKEVLMRQHPNSGHRALNVGQ